MKWIFAALLFLTSPLVLAQAQKPATNNSTGNSANKTGSEVLATVGSKKITLAEFSRRYQEVLDQVVSNIPSKKVFLEDIIRYEIGLQEAKKRKLENDPFVADRINQELYKGLLEKELGQKVQESKVTEAEMKAYYAKNPQIRISDILIEFKTGATPSQKAEAEKRAREILDEVLKSKRSFEELVKLYSDDLTTKNIGGDIGYQSRLTIVPELYNTALSLKINQIAPELVKTAFGFHIIKLTGKKSYQEAAKREIRMAVFDEKRKVLFDQFFEKIRPQYKVDVNSSLIE